MVCFGAADGQFSPRGVSVDTAGNIYVSDSGTNRIQKFNSAGEFLMKFGSQGTADGQFSPRGVSVDTAGNIYVADFDNHRIQKFVLDKEAPVVIVNSLPNNIVGSNNFTISGEAEDGLSAISTVEYQIDATSGDWHVCSASDGTWNSLSEEFSCDITGLSNGSHTIYIRSIDSYTNPNTEGNYGEYTFMVSTPAPTGTVANTKTLAVSPSVTPSGTPTEAPSAKIEVYGVQVTDDKGTSLLDTPVYIDGQKYVTDKNGKIYIEKELTLAMNVEVEINGKKVKGSVLKEKIVVKRETKSEQANYYWLLVLLAVGAGIWWVRRKKR